LNNEVPVLVYVYVHHTIRTSNHVNIIYVRSTVPKKKMNTTQTTTISPFLYP